MRFWLLTVGETLPMLDAGTGMMRTALLAQTLVDRGHQVTWWQSSVDHVRKRQLFERDTDLEWRQNLVVRFLHARPYRRNVSPGRYLHHLQTARRFETRAEQEVPPDAIVAALPTPELSATAVAYAKRHDVAVFIDIRDLWPDEFVLRMPRLAAPIAKLLSRPMAGSVKHALLHATGITAVSPSYLDWGLRQAGRPAGPSDRVFLMGYPPLPQEDGEDRQLLANLGADPERKIFLFVSNFNNSTDVPTILAAARLTSHRPDIQFVICGAGENEALYRTAAAGLSNVVACGWVDGKQIAALLRVTYAGLVAYRDRTAVSLPNKFFGYLSGGVPILVSLGGNARDIVEAQHCGQYFPPEQPAALAALVEAYADDEALRNQQSANARRFFESECRADTIYRKYTEFLEERVAARFAPRVE